MVQTNSTGIITGESYISEVDDCEHARQRGIPVTERLVPYGIGYIDCPKCSRPLPGCIEYPDGRVEADCYFCGRYPAVLVDRQPQPVS